MGMGWGWLYCGHIWVNVGNCDHCSKIPVFLHVLSILFLVFLSSLPFCLVFLVGSFVSHLIPSSLHNEFEQAS